MAAVRITEVWLDNAGCDKETGIGTYLAVYLDNGQNLTISLDSKADEPLFTDILMSRCNNEAKTNGERVYWDNGASLTVDEILTMLQISPKGKQGKWR